MEKKYIDYYKLDTISYDNKNGDFMRFGTDIELALEQLIDKPSEVFPPTFSIINLLAYFKELYIIVEEDSDYKNKEIIGWFILKGKTIIGFEIFPERRKQGIARKILRQIRDRWSKVIHTEKTKKFWDKMKKERYL
jgi:hypothetical protein